MTRTAKIRIGVLSVALAGMTAVAYAQFVPPATPPMPAAEAAKHTVYDFKMNAVDGEPLPLAQFRGKVVLLVNTASKCGLAPQFETLKTIDAKYKAQGFTVVAIPSQSFNQEYASNKEVSTHCKMTLGVKFPIAETQPVVGPDAIPLYKWAAARLPGQTPKWNFHKYLVGRDGKLIAAFGSRTVPDAPEVTAAIEAALKAPAKRG